MSLPSKQNEEIKKCGVVTVALCGEADEKNFSFVNESPRRLLSRRAGIEGRGALRSFALATQVESEGDGS